MSFLWRFITWFIQTQPLCFCSLIFERLYQLSVNPQNCSQVTAVQLFPSRSLCRNSAAAQVALWARLSLVRAGAAGGLFPAEKAQAWLQGQKVGGSSGVPPRGRKWQESPIYFPDVSVVSTSLNPLISHHWVFCSHFSCFTSALLFQGKKKSRKEVSCFSDVWHQRRSTNWNFSGRKKKKKKKDPTLGSFQSCANLWEIIACSVILKLGDDLVSAAGWMWVFWENASFYRCSGRSSWRTWQIGENKNTVTWGFHLQLLICIFAVFLSVWG